MPADANDILFEALTSVGLTVRVSRDRWLVIVSAKHPVMAGREFSVREEATRRWTCAVAKRVRVTGFFITACPTDAIKEGVRIWPK